MRKHNAPMSPSEQREGAPYAQNVDSMDWDNSVVLTEEERAHDPLAHERRELPGTETAAATHIGPRIVEAASSRDHSSGRPAVRHGYAEQEGGLSQEHHDARESQRAKAVRDAREIVSNFSPSQRKYFDDYMDATASSYLLDMRESTVASSTEEAAPSWSAWIAGEASRRADDNELSSILEWNVHVVNRLQTSEEFRNVETEFKHHLYDSLQDWSDRGIVTSMPRERRIKEANVKVANPITSIRAGHKGYYVAEHDPNRLVVAPGLGRTTHEQVEHMKHGTFGVRHILLHEGWHYTFGQLDEWWMKEGLAEFATISMSIQKDVSKQTPEDHMLLLADGGYPEIRGMLFVLATAGKKLVGMDTLLRADTSAPNSRERAFLDRQLDNAWEMQHTRGTVDQWIQAGTDERMNRIMANPKRRGPAEPTNSEIWSARTDAVSDVTEYLMQRSKELHSGRQYTS